MHQRYNMWARTLSYLYERNRSNSLSILCPVDWVSMGLVALDELCADIIGMDFILGHFINV